MFKAGYATDRESLPQPLSAFLGDENVEMEADNPVDTHDDGELDPENPTTFGDLLNPNQVAWDLITADTIDIAALTGLLATRSKSSYHVGQDAPCDECINSGGGLFWGECRAIGADDLLEHLELEAPTCGSCMAQGIVCDYQQAKEAGDLDMGSSDKEE